MFIDELDYETCWSLWMKIQFNPIKTARLMFPNRPPQYVMVAKLIKNYLANKGTALSLADKLKGADKKDRIDLKKRIKLYTGICADIYCKIPAWGRSFNTTFLKEEEK